MPSVEIFHEDGTTETIPTTTGFRFEQQIGEMYQFKIYVERSLANSVSLTRKRDEVEVSGYPRGVLTDIERGDATHTLTVTSPEWYATLTQPTLGGVEAQGTDSELITDRINAVSEWSAGSIATLTGPMTYVFSHTFEHTALRTIEANVPGEIQFAGDGTVTYTDQLGTDRSGSVTLSPANQNVEGRIRITERGTTLDATHVRVIGAHEGEAQRFATLVPSSDGATYENRVNYTTSRWEPGDPRDWDTWSNKDVMSQDTIEEEAATLGAELTEEYVEAETTVRGVDLNLGDFVQVVKPDAGLDKRMRVHRLVTRTVEGNPADVVQDVVLSTRTVARDDANEDKRDLQRYNRAWQGASVAINVGPFRSAVDSGFPIEIPFRYPDLEFENTATLQVRGLPYRTDSRPLQHSHNVDILVPNHDHDVTIDVSDHTHTVDIVVPDHAHSMPAVFADTSMNDGHTHEYIRTGNIGQGAATTDTQILDDTVATETSDAGGGFLTTETTDNGGGFFDTETSDTAAGSEAGIFTTGDTPSDVDVSVNGTEVATNIGTGAFQTTVDVGGEFTNDTWNTIELSSDTLGLLQTTLFLEGYDRIGTR